MTPAAARLSLIAAALLFSTGGAGVKLCELPALEIAGLRSGIAAIVILLLVPASRRMFRPKVALVALAYATTLSVFVIANRLTTAANTIFLQSSAPIYVLLLSPFLLKEPVRRADISVLILLAAGLVTILTGAEPASSIASDPELGNTLATVAGLTWALTLMGLRSLARDERQDQRGGAAAACALGSILSCLVCLLFALPLSIFGSAASDWLLILYLGVFQVGLAYCCLFRGLAKVPATEAALLLMAEPVFNPVWAYVVHGEQPGGFAILGGCIVTVGLVMRALLARDRKSGRRDRKTGSRDRDAGEEKERAEPHGTA